MLNRLALTQTHRHTDTQAQPYTQPHSHIQLAAHRQLAYVHVAKLLHHGAWDASAA